MRLLDKPEDEEFHAFASISKQDAEVLLKYFHRARDKLAETADHASDLIAVGNCQGGRKALFDLENLLLNSREILEKRRRK